MTTGRFLSSASRLVTGTAATFVVGFAQNVMIARGLGASGYGAWATVMATWFLLYALFTQGTEEALLRHIEEYRDRADDEPRLTMIFAGAMAVSVLMRLACGAGLVAASYVLPHLTDQPAVLAQVFLIQAATVVIDCMETVWRCVMRDQRRFNSLALAPLGIILVLFSVIAVLSLSGELTLTRLALAILGVTLFKSALYAVMTRRALAARYGIGIRGLLGRLQSLRGDAPLVASYWQSVKLGLTSNFFAGAVKHGDVLILVWFVGDAALGIYRIAKMLLEYASQLVRLLGVAAFGDMAQLAVQNRTRELAAFLRRVTVVGLLATAAVAAPAFLFIDDFVALFYGPEFAEAALPFRIMLPSLLVFMALFWTTELVFVLHRLRFYVATTAIILVAFAVGGTVLSATHGTIGMAIATAVATAAGPLVLLVKSVGWLRAGAARERAEIQRRDREAEAEA